MSTISYYLCIAVQVLLAAWIVVAAWLCFRRTKIFTFLVLGIFLAILWPIFNHVTFLALNSSIQLVLDGNKPTVFPFTLISSSDEIPNASWKMSPSEFVTKFKFVRDVLHFFCMAFMLTIISRSLKIFTSNDKNIPS